MTDQEKTPQDNRRPVSNEGHRKTDNAVAVTIAALALAACGGFSRESLGARCGVGERAEEEAWRKPKACLGTAAVSVAALAPSLAGPFPRSRAQRS
jgi:hypothetical protein